MHFNFKTALVTLFLFQVSCSSRSEREGAGSREKRGEVSSQTDDDTATDESKNSPVSSLSQGTFMVFGIELPRGMIPTKGPEKVYRFKSSLSTGMLLASISVQIKSQRTVKEGEGYLIRNATSTHPKGNAKGDELIAFRIIKRRTGGSVLDVWLEEKPVVITEGSLPGQEGAVWRGKKKAAPRTSSEWKEKALKSRLEALRIMEKIERKEPLTKEELNSPYFD